jgi:hypothetical protein
MPEWSIRLTGHAFDLEELSDHFHSPERNVTKDEDGHYYLRSTDFDSMADDQAVHERALELVELMNQAAKFHAGDGYRPVELDAVTRIDEDGKRVHHIMLAGQMEGRSRMSAKPTVIREGGSVATPQPPSEVVSMAALAERDDRVADALRFFARDSWVNLYKAWEIVGDAAGGEHTLIRNGWATKKTKDRFTQTAQSRKALGDEARHASAKVPVPQNPMSLEEARAFVKSVIEAWARTL